MTNKVSLRQCILFASSPWWLKRDSNPRPEEIGEGDCYVIVALVSSGSNLYIHSAWFNELHQAQPLSFKLTVFTLSRVQYVHLTIKNTISYPVYLICILFVTDYLKMYAGNNKGRKSWARNRSVISIFYYISEMYKKYSELLHFFEFSSFWKMTSTVYVPLWVNCLNRSCLMPWRPIRRSTTSPLRSAKNLNLNENAKKNSKRLIKKVS